MHFSAVIAHWEVPLEGGGFAQRGYISVIRQKYQDQIVPLPSFKRQRWLGVDLESQSCILSPEVPVFAAGNEYDLIFVVEGDKRVDFIAL